jgi:TonB family protein
MEYTRRGRTHAVLCQNHTPSDGPLGPALRRSVRVRTGPSFLRATRFATLKVCSKKKPQPCATAPHPIYTRDPEYSDKARKKKKNGTVILETVVGTDGLTHDIHVLQPLGYGLDEQAVKALGQWKFEPATKDGQPVPVLLQIEMNFRLY